MVAAGAMDDARGRLGRPWAYVPGHSFAISFIVTIPESVATDDAVNGWMSMIAGLATLDAIEGTLTSAARSRSTPNAGSISNGRTTFTAMDSSSAARSPRSPRRPTGTVTSP